ncbi:MULTISPECIES: DUF4238 domain-containing protein [Halobacteriales]|uniref:DUF4238 domain-containing protein n=2 Tax=Halobacteriales TaxID=2235 RepID=A0A1I0N0R8_9EURY|nr:DUF4238 domain-containing protein [Natrinema salifodinae]SEV94680.1 Protein of unknown function [Natrinema salifodinae]
MPEYRNQHYVPQFYLTRFSDDGDRINLYNVQAQQEFNEPISRVCSRSYFYSDDTDVEIAIGQIEGSLAEGLTEIINAEAVSEFQVQDDLKPNWLQVMQFLTFQEARTALSKEELERDSDLFFEEFVRAGVEAGELEPEYLDKVRDGEITFEWDQSPQIHSMLYQLHCAPLLADLYGTIFVNDTSSAFVTSDHPVVRHNPYYADEGFSQLAGWQARGLQIYCPLSPDLYLLLHDPECYDVNSRPEGSLTINDEDVIQELNRLQLVQCENNVFYGESGRQAEMQQLHDELEPFVDRDRSSRGAFESQSGIGVYTHIGIPEFQPDLPFVTENPGVEFTPERVEGSRKEQEKFWEEQFGDLL